MREILYCFKNYLSKFEQIQLYVFVLFSVNTIVYFSLWLLIYIVSRNFLYCIILALTIYRIATLAISIVVDFIFTKTIEILLIMNDSEKNNSAPCRNVRSLIITWSIIIRFPQIIFYNVFVDKKKGRSECQKKN